MSNITNFKKLSFLLILSLVIAFGGKLSATTITWLGGNGEWDTAANWDLGTVPTEFDEVIINSGTVNIEQLGHASSINLRGGQINLIESGTLLIAPKTVDNVSETALRIYLGASFINEGNLIFIWNGTNENADSHFIKNYGIFQNEESGLVYMSGDKFYAVDNRGESFVNHGTIDIYNVWFGIYSRAEIANYGTLSINSSEESLYLDCYFYNGVSGVIRCNNSIINYQDVNNFGRINIDSDLPLSLAFSIEGKLENHETGSLYISGPFEIGLEGYDYDCEIYNNGVIDIALDNIDSKSISNSGIFINFQNGNITCESYLEDLVLNQVVCQNYGTWRFDTDHNSPYGRVDIEGYFVNENSGLLYIEKGLTLGLNSTIENLGHMFVKSQISSPIINGEIINSGVLNDVFDNLPPISNKSILARPIIYKAKVSNALDINKNTEGSVIGWYTDRSGNLSAGSYDSGANVFYPNANSIKLRSVFVEIQNNSNGVIQRHEVLFVNRLLLKDVAKKDIETDIEGRYKYDIVSYPNPTTDVLNIESRNFNREEIFEARLVNVQGITVARKTCYDNCLINIPSDLVNGIYFLSILKDGVQFQAPEKIKVFR